MTETYRESLEGLSRLRGITGAMMVSADDGLVVAESLMEGIPGEAVAALAASLMRRMGPAGSAHARAHLRLSQTRCLPPGLLYPRSCICRPPSEHCWLFQPGRTRC